MSLINDALKRAKEAQAKAPLPEAAIPHLRPVEPAPTGLRSAGLLLPIVLSLVALGGLLFLWQAAPNNVPVHATSTAPLAGRSTNSPEGGARSPLGAAAVAPEPGNAAAGSNEQRRAEDSAPCLAAAAGSPTNAAPAGVAASSTTTTNVSAPPVPPVVKPALPRLQAIVFNPARPSAMIGGKTVFIGDRLGEFRVLAIDRQSATLAGATRTNILTLAGEDAN